MIQALQDSFLQVRERGEDGHLSIEEQAFVGDSEIDPGATIKNTTLHRCIGKAKEVTGLEMYFWYAVS